MNFFKDPIVTLACWIAMILSFMERSVKDDDDRESSFRQEW